MWNDELVTLYTYIYIYICIHVYRYYIIYKETGNNFASNLTKKSKENCISHSSNTQHNTHTHTHARTNIVEMTNHYQFEVVMTCSGCSNAIDRVLKRLEPDVSRYSISLEKQTVDVETSLPLETVLNKIQKTGKEVKSSKVVETPVI